MLHLLLYVCACFKRFDSFLFVVVAFFDCFFSSKAAVVVVFFFVASSLMFLMETSDDNRLICRYRHAGLKCNVRFDTRIISAKNKECPERKPHKNYM